MGRAWLVCGCRSVAAVGGSGEGQEGLNSDAGSGNDMTDPSNTSRVLGALFGTPSNRKGRAIAICVEDLRRGR